MTSRLTRCAALGLALALAPIAAADVLTVGPTGDFPDVASAVAAAVDFDVILVSAGTYDDPVDIGDVSLTIVADVGEEVALRERVTVEGLSAGKTVALIGLTLDGQLLGGPFGGSGPALPATLILRDNLGSVRFEDGAISGNQGFSRTGPALEIVDCADVALARTDVSGGLDAGFDLSTEDESPPGMTVTSSTVVVHGGTITGTSVARAKIPGFSIFVANEGEPAMEVRSGAVFLAGVTLEGGEGSPAALDCPTSGGIVGGDGGAALELNGAGAIVRRLDTALVGGPGGVPAAESPAFPGCFAMPGGATGLGADVQAGLLVDLAGDARGFSMQNPARSLQATTATLTGQPGDQVGVFWSFFPGTLYKFGLKGHALLDFTKPTRFFTVGTLPGSGELSIPLTFDELTPGWEGIALPFQSVFFGGPGQLYMGPPVMTVILDAGL